MLAYRFKWPHNVTMSRTANRDAVTAAGQWVREFRKAIRMTLAQVAGAAGMYASQLSTFENGRGYFSEARLSRVLSVMGVVNAHDVAASLYRPTAHQIQHYPARSAANSRARRGAYRPTAGSVAERIRRARLLRGWTQLQLARAAGFSRVWISHLEIERAKPSPEALERILAVLAEREVV